MVISRLSEFQTLLREWKWKIWDSRTLLWTLCILSEEDCNLIRVCEGKIDKFKALFVVGAILVDVDCKMNFIFLFIRVFIDYFLCFSRSLVLFA